MLAGKTERGRRGAVRGWHSWPVLGAVAAGAARALLGGVLSVHCADSGGDESENSAALSTDPRCTQESTTALYARKIEPLLAADRPKTCNECHLSGIDLGSFVRATPCETLACLAEDKLIDRKAPDQSLILSWIQRASPTSPLITQAVIDDEYTGFKEWIEHFALCNDCAGVRCERGEHEAFCDVGPEPTEFTAEASDPGGCNDLVLEQLFRDTVYASRGRCAPCHIAGEASVGGAVQWIEQAETCDQASLRSLRNVLREGFIDINDPDRSLLLTKPLSVEQGGVAHGGDSKFTATGDPGYDSFRYWVRRQAECLR
jgi:hypothetical protein